MDFKTLKDTATVEKTIKALAEKNVEAIVVKNKAEAMEKIKSLIPAGASVQTGASTTLDQIGFTDYLKDDKHGWNNLKAAIVAETDPIKQTALRKQATLSDFYLGSVHALVESGEYVVASNTGSQLPSIAYSSHNLILVVSTKKIVPTLSDAMTRIQEHVVPLEEERMRKTSDGKYGTTLSKELIVRYESPFNQRKVRMILVNEDIGF